MLNNVNWTYKMLRIGRFTGPGKVSFRGSLFFRVPPTFEGRKLSDLNNAVGVFEYEAIHVKSG